MSQAAIRTTIYNAVNGVSDKGVCYDYERWAAEWGDFLALFKTTISGVDQIRGWEVAYRGFNPIRDRQFSLAVQHAHNFQVRGYMAIKDANATEKAFAALAEAVCAALDGDGTLHGSTYVDATPAALARFEPLSFAGVLCHYAQINITITEQVS